MRRLSDVELFRIGPDGLEEIGDRTLDLRLDAAERQAMKGYQEAVAEEMLSTPEAV